jgi:hypothetical protein
VKDNQDVDVGTTHPLVDIELLKRFGYREKTFSSQQVQAKPDQPDSEDGGATAGLKLFVGDLSADRLAEVITAVGGNGDLLKGALAGLEALRVDVAGLLRDLLGGVQEKAQPALDEANAQLAKINEAYQRAKSEIDRIRKSVLGAIGRDADTRTQWKQSRLRNWNRLNVYFENGSISFIGREAVRVGERVSLPDEAAKDGTRGLEGYIVSVDHSWGYGGKFETKIGVERCISEETRQRVLGLAVTARP